MTSLSGQELSISPPTEACWEPESSIVPQGLLERRWSQGKGKKPAHEDWGITGGWDGCGTGRLREALGWDP